jgi:hypothetical protein
MVCLTKTCVQADASFSNNILTTKSEQHINQEGPGLISRRHYFIDVFDRIVVALKFE